MNVTVEVSFSFKRDLGEDRVTVDLDNGSSVLSALRALVKLHPKVSSRIFGQNGEVRPYINVLKNGGNVRFQRGFDTMLQEGDHLTILPPVGGG